MQIEDVNVTPLFFTPLTQTCVSRPRCEMFRKTWERYMRGYRAGTIDDYLPRIMHVISYSHDMTVGSVTRSARVATSIAVWFGTTNGYFFMEKLRDGIDRKAPSFDNLKNKERMISLWSIENSLYHQAGGHGGRRLQQIIQEGKQGEKLGTLTALDTDTAEILMIWLATSEGWRLLDLLKRTSDRYYKGVEEGKIEP